MYILGQSVNKGSSGNGGSSVDKGSSGDDPRDWVQMTD